MSRHIVLVRTMPQRVGQCATPGCHRPLAPMGNLCKTHSEKARYTGAAGIPNLTQSARKPFVHAAFLLVGGTMLHNRYAVKKRLSHEQIALQSSMQQLLQTCTPYLVRQRNVLRYGFTTQEKANCILAVIHKRLGNTAAVRILGAACGTASMTMPTSRPEYYKVQLARAVYGLCRGERYELYGKRYKARIILGYRMSLALYALIEPIIHYWLKDGGRQRIVERVANWKPRQLSDRVREECGQSAQRARLKRLLLWEIKRLTPAVSYTALSR